MTFKGSFQHHLCYDSDQKLPCSTYEVTCIFRGAWKFCLYWKIFGSGKYEIFITASVY